MFTFKPDIMGQPRFVITTSMDVSAFLEVFGGFSYTVVRMQGFSTLDWVAESNIFDTILCVIIKIEKRQFVPTLVTLRYG